MKDLLTLWRIHGQRRYLKVADRSGRAIILLGMGPNGKIVGWYENETQIREFNPDDKKWMLVMCWPS